MLTLSMPYETAISFKNASTLWISRPNQIVFLLSGSQACFKKLKQSASNNWLLILLLFSALFGAILGAILRRVGPFRAPQFHAREMMYLQFPTEIYINIMKVIEQTL